MRVFRRLLLALCPLALVSPLCAQPAPDQFIPRYQSDATPYPLYAGKFGESPEWTPARLRLLAENFDAYYGTPAFTAEQVKQLRALKPRFQVINYKGTWAIRDIETYERNHRRDVLYYRAANLKAAVSSSATTIELCDQLGMLVWQDQVSGGANPKWKQLHGRAPDPTKKVNSNQYQAGDSLDAPWPDVAHAQGMAEFKSKGIRRWRLLPDHGCRVGDQRPHGLRPQRHQNPRRKTSRPARAALQGVAVH